MYVQCHRFKVRMNTAVVINQNITCFNTAIFCWQKHTHVHRCETAFSLCMCMHNYLQFNFHRYVRWGCWKILGQTHFSKISILMTIKQMILQNGPITIYNTDVEKVVLARNFFNLTWIYISKPKYVNTKDTCFCLHTYLLIYLHIIKLLPAEFNFKYMFAIHLECVYGGSYKVDAS